MRKVKHIYTVKDKLKEELRHLVEINGKNIVFVFNYKEELTAVRYKNIYAFAGSKKPSDIKEFIKNKGVSDLNLGLYEYFHSSKFQESYYLNLYNMQLKYDKVWNKFSDVLNVINNEVKSNNTVLMFKQ